VRYIYLIPLGNIDQSFFKRLPQDLEKQFQLPVSLIEKIEIPDYTYDSKRKQYSGSKIIAELSRLDLSDVEKILGITSVDLFSEGLNFIFGEAESPGKIALISTARLDPRFYRKKFNSEIFYQRILKEASHELGHTFSLNHCPSPSCVMHFSNTIEDTDVKNHKFCEKCKKILELVKF
jgi:archaemetzincin